MSGLAVVALVLTVVGAFAFGKSAVLTVVSLVLALAVAAAAAAFGRSTVADSRRRPAWAMLIPLTALVSVAVWIWFDWDARGGVAAATPFTWSLRVAAALALSYFIPRFPLARVRLATVVAMFIGCAIGHIRETPTPPIDVWYFQQIGSAEILAGRNPYSISYPNIYHPDSRQYGPAVLVQDGQRVGSCPYPPMSLLLVVPGRLIGDVRWALLAASTAAAVLLVLIGRRLGLPWGHPAEAVIILLLFRPVSIQILQGSWTEPLLTLMAGLVGLALTYRSRWGLILATAGFLAVKQYAVLCLPALWAVAPLTRRDWVCIFGLAALTALPFAATDYNGLWAGVVLFQFRQPFRADSLSVTALVDAQWGIRLSSVWGFALAGLLAAAAAWRARNRVVMFAIGNVAVMLAFFLFNKQAFLNYYWFVLYLAAMAGAMAVAPIQSVGAVGVSGADFAATAEVTRQTPTA